MFIRSLSLACAISVASAGCIDWLEVDEGPEDEDYQLPLGEPLVMPSEPALLDAPGPLVPRTPGLRVPRAGYWTRARLDALDLVLPYTWVSLTAAKGRGADQVLLRLEASTAQGDGLAEIGAQGIIGFRTVIPIALPEGTDSSVIRDGFELPEEALALATTGLRTSAQDLWLITLTRLSFDRVDAHIIVGSLEGEARRGAKGQRVRKLAVTFLALRAPDGPSAVEANPELELPPDAGGPGQATP